MNRQPDGRTDRWPDGRMGGRMDGHTLLQRSDGASKKQQPGQAKNPFNARNHIASNTIAPTDQNSDSYA